MAAARRREIDVVVVWRLDRWGRSVTDLLGTLQKLEHLGVGFVCLNEALGLTTPAGRAMARYWLFLRRSNERFCRNAFGQIWPTPGRTASGWASRQLRPHMLRKSRNYIARASANPRSLVGCGSDARR